jgi:hypothetical protein
LPAYEAKPENTCQDALNHLDFVLKIHSSCLINPARIGAYPPAGSGTRIDVLCQCPRLRGLYNQVAFLEHLAGVRPCCMDICDSSCRSV